MPDEELVAHILDAAIQAQVYVSGLTRDQFLQSRLRQDAVIRCFQVIGEAARRMSNDMRIDHPEIEWRKMIGMRTLVIHEYFRIDLDVIWDAVQDNLPPLITALMPLIPPPKE